MLSSQFIKAGDRPNTYFSFAAAPWFRKTFYADALPSAASVTIGTPGFYRAFINGREITKGPLAPYIANADHAVYYDEYDITADILTGENVLVILAGNGNLSSPGGSVWDFDRFPWTDAQKVAFCIETDGETFEADGSVKCRPSHIIFDDLRSGERHDGRSFCPALLYPGYDDSAWDCAKSVFAPKGTKKLCTAHKISFIGDLEGKYIGKYRLAPGYKAHKMAYADRNGNIYPTEPKDENEEAFVFDFGMNTAGIPVLTLNGKKDAKIELQFAEYIDKNGFVNCNNIDFYPEGFSQKDVYICRGEANETFEPYFTYHGARYCAVFGLDEEMLSSVKLTFRRISSITRRLADFRCSDKNAEKLFRMSVNSDISNFVYFPTDCPQREKNGWTGDAAISAERMSMFYDVYDDYREWMFNIRKAQKKTGELPSIVPTDTWGYGGNYGPSWDRVISAVPAFACRFTGRTEIAEENCEAIFTYLKYLESRMDEDGLIESDLGDWLPVDKWKKANDKVCAVASACALTDCAVEIFNACGRTDHTEFAKGLRARLIYALRRHFVNAKTGICDNGRQSAQALALNSGIFSGEEETKKALAVLLGAIADDGGHLNFGLQGSTAVFPVLFENGYGDLAWDMIMREDFPSYGHFISQGLTALPENFYKDDESDINSLNHHMFGTVALYMVKYVAGITADADGTVFIAPHYIKALDFAEASVITAKGEVKFRWERLEDGSILNVLTAPEGTDAVCGKTEGKFMVNGLEEENVNREGYGIFETI